MKQKVVKVYFDEDLYARLKQHCDTLRVDVSTFLRMKAAEEVLKHSINRDVADYMKRKFDELIKLGMASLDN